MQRRIDELTVNWMGVDYFKVPYQFKSRSSGLWRHVALW